MTKEDQKQVKREPRRVDYGDATPEQVAAALLRHRPKPKPE